MYITRIEEEGQSPYWVYIENGTYRRIKSPQGLVEYQKAFEVRDGSTIQLKALRRGPSAPALPGLSFDPDIKRSASLGKFRENFGLNAVGSGIEIGAGGRPLVTSLGSEVRYVDRFSQEEMMKFSSARHGAKQEDLMPIDVVDHFDKLSEFHNEELDFIIAAHVIEHTSNPIGAIKISLDRLRTGGKLLLIVPDRNRTHDKSRPVTTLEHLVADYYEPSKERDFEHYVERLYYVNKVGLEERERFVEAWTSQMDIHLHTFTFQSLTRIADFIQQVFPARLAWSHDGILDGRDSKEMYLSIQKS